MRKPTKKNQAMPHHSVKILSRSLKEKRYRNVRACAFGKTRRKTILARQTDRKTNKTNACETEQTQTDTDGRDRYDKQKDRKVIERVINMHKKV